MAVDPAFQGALPNRAPMQHHAPSAAAAYQRPGDARIQFLIEATVEMRFQAFLEGLPDAMLGVDRRATVCFANRQAELLFGMPRADLVGAAAGLVLDATEPGTAPAQWHADLANAASHLAGTSLQCRARRAGGGSIPVEITLSLVDMQEGPWAIAAVRDVTERLKAQEAVTAARAEAEHRADELTQRNREILMVSEMGGLLQSCIALGEVHHVLTRFGPRLFPHASGGIFLQNAAGNLLEAAVTWGPNSPGSVVFAPEECWGLRRGRPHTEDPHNRGPHCPHRGLSKGGSICIPMLAQSQALGLVHLVCNHGPNAPVDLHEEGSPDSRRLWESTCSLAVTVGEHVALALANFSLRETLRTQSIRDPLTDLFNRRYLDESLERELRRAARDAKPLAVVMLDIDYFKAFNDDFGHSAGDMALTGLSRVLRESVRGADIACRYGGEEFLLVLPDTTLEAACRRADELRERVRTLASPAPGHDVTVSLGVAGYPLHAQSAQDLIRAADMALYRAKQTGRDRVAVAG